jgi:mono/diheme cytochrome c family protein
MADERTRSETVHEGETPESERGDESVITMHEPIAREAEEPRDGYDPIPTTLVFLFLALAGWAGWYLGTQSGQFSPDVFMPGGEKAAPAAEARKEPELSPQELGSQVYSRVCSGCHQSDGKGMGQSFPPLNGSEWVVGRPEVFARIVLHGLQGPIEVKGTLYRGQMPAWGDQLSDREIAAVLTYVRSSFGNDAAPVSESFVARVRSETESQTEQWTAQELEQVPEMPASEEPAATDAGAAPKQQPEKGAGTAEPQEKGAGPDRPGKDGSEPGEPEGTGPSEAQP